MNRMYGEARCPVGRFLFMGLFEAGSIVIPCCRRYASLVEARGDGVISVTHLPRAERRSNNGSATNAATGSTPETASETVRKP